MTEFAFLSAMDIVHSTQEQEMVASFITAPSLSGAGKIARYLMEKKHPRILLLFWQQVTKVFPQWAAARVCYAESLLQEGMLDMAWAVLTTAPVPLQDNPKAWHLLNQVAWILEYENLQGKIRVHQASSLELVGLTMWESPQAAALCEVFQKNLPEERLVQDFIGFISQKDQILKILR